MQLPDGRQIDISLFGMDDTDVLFADKNMHGSKDWLKLHADKCPEVPTGSRLGPCIARPSKIVCVGLNYAQHAAAIGMDAPKEPVLFFKSTTAICGPYDPLIIPKGSEENRLGSGTGGGHRAKYLMRRLKKPCTMQPATVYI